MLSAARVCF